MKYKRTAGAYIVEIPKGSKIVENLKRFCEKEKVRFGTIQAIGAAKEVTLRFFDADKKKYSDKRFKMHFEITNLTGNISEVDGKVYLHLHISLADRAFHMIGGHLLEAIVGGTFEAVIKPLPGRIGRKFSREVGLNLYDF